MEESKILDTGSFGYVGQWAISNSKSVFSFVH